MTGGFHAIIGGWFEIITSGGFHQNMQQHQALKKLAAQDGQKDEDGRADLQNRVK